MFSTHDGAATPIAAIATAAGRGAVGIVRVSGHGIAPVVGGLCGRPLKAREATFLRFLAGDGSTIDRGLAIHFPAPHSYTGEDVLELQAHGGPVVLQLLLARCLEAGASIGLRLARPGEFTERAFLNDKLDLAQAEAVSDLIDAGTEAAARSASRSLSGAFSAEINRLRDRLIELRMLVEATLDFPEEELDFLAQARLHERLGGIVRQVDTVLDQARQGALLREGMQIVLAGQPNVGKSSLLNALAGTEVAIVTAVPGTTRDKVSQTIQIDGVALHVVDTAGLRDAGDEVERIGVERSWAAIASADAVLFLHDLTRASDMAYQRDEARIAARLNDGLTGRHDRLLHIFNKCDAVPDAEAPAPHVAAALSDDVTPRSDAAAPLRVSARTGAGLDRLRRRLLELAGWHGQPEGLFMARTRHVDALRRTAAHLAHAEAHAAAADAALELLAEELRLGHDALGEITGAFTSDDLLGEIFGRFCIGK